MPGEVVGGLSADTAVGFCPLCGPLLSMVLYYFLQVELQMVVSHLLGIELGSSGRATSAHNL